MTLPPSERVEISSRVRPANRGRSASRRLWPASKHAVVGLTKLAASITFLLSDDGTNVNGAILASDGGWSAL